MKKSTSMRGIIIILSATAMFLVACSSSPTATPAPSDPLAEFERQFRQATGQSLRQAGEDASELYRQATGESLQDLRETVEREFTHLTGRSFQEAGRELDREFENLTGSSFEDVRRDVEESIETITESQEFKDAQEAAEDAVERGKEAIDNFFKR